MISQEVIDRAFKHVRDTLNDNQELFLAQIIKMNQRLTYFSTASAINLYLIVLVLSFGWRS